MEMMIATSISLVIVFSIVMHLSWRLRYILFLFFIFLSIARLPLGLGFMSDQSLRLPIAAVLFFSGYKQVFKAVYTPTNPRSLFYLLLWTVLLIVYWSLYRYRNTSDLFVIVGNLLFFILVVAYVSFMNSKELKILIILVVVSRIPGLLINIPNIRNILERIGFYWGTVYHQSAGQSSIFIIPFLLLGVSTTKEVWKKLALWLLISLTFIILIESGARSPVLIFGLILIVWWRKFIYAVLLALLIAFSFEFYMSTNQSEYISDRYNRIFSVISTGDVTEAENVEFRYEHLEYGMNAFLGAPVFGHGYRSWLEIMSEEVGVIGYSMAPHNEPLRILVEYGLLGLTIFLLFLWNCIKKLKTKPSRDYWLAVSYTFEVSILAHFLVNIFHNSLLSRSFFFLAAVGSILPEQINKFAQQSKINGQQGKNNS